MKIVEILTIYLFIVNFIDFVISMSTPTCDAHCHILYDDIKEVRDSTLLGTVKNDICHCAQWFGPYYKSLEENIDNPDLFCNEKYNGTDYYSINFIHGNRTEGFMCLLDYKCDNSICSIYCDKEHQYEEHEGYCYQGIECRCKSIKQQHDNEHDKHDKHYNNNKCIVSINDEESLIEYHTKNNVDESINDVLFNLKNINSLLCSQTPKNIKIFVENGIVKGLSGHKYECNILCQRNFSSYRYFDCFLK